jgi:hypothetical protein
MEHQFRILRGKGLMSTIEHKTLPGISRNLDSAAQAIGRIILMRKRQQGYGNPKAVPNTKTNGRDAAHNH